MSRIVPLIKIAIAGALIAFLLWFVPIRDHLSLVRIEGHADQVLVGTVVERTETEARFSASDGGIFLVHLDGERVDQVTTPDGTVLTPSVEVAGPDTDPKPTTTLQIGLITTLRNVSLVHCFIALALLFAGSVVAVYRWHLLLRAVDLGIPFSRTFSLTFIGAFFNNVMPGLTGGDLVKAYYIARDHRSRKTEAIITVLLDRVLGLTGLAVVAALVIPIDFASYKEVAPWIYGILAGEVVVACLFFSRRIRRNLGIDVVLEKLPFGGAVSRIDQAVFLYRFRRKILGISLVLSMLVHVIIITAIGTIGVGLGLDLSFQAYYAIIPIGLIASALPISPSGIGVGEATLVYFLATVGVSKPEALSLAFLYRIAQLTVSLIGGICLARLDDRMSAEEMERMDDSSGPSAQIVDSPEMAPSQQNQG